MRGKSVCSLEEHVAKIHAAVDARRAVERPFFITARTDALGPLGIDEAIRRGIAYKEAGADVIFVEAPENEEQMRRIVREIPGAKTVNNIEGGSTPILPLEQLVGIGYFSVGFVLTGLYAAAHALAHTYAHLLQHGTSAGLEDRMMHFDDFADVVGLDEKYALDERYRGS
jgi:methylisocitrate lyase